jgi:serine/threonine protein kinase
MLRGLEPGDPQVIGPYRLRGRLGRGGMGQVFLGTSAGGRLVAVKVVRSDLATDPEFRARFRREVAVARRVSGQFTAPVIDADIDGPVPWLATAYVPGPSLADAVVEHGPLPASSVLRLAAGLAEGLSAIHAAGVVHRDLKPANVLLAEDGPRVIDFGISLAAAASPLTRMGFVVGSPGYMSPEQASGRPVGPASDIFALGAVLAFAAAGEAPFGAGSAPTLAYRAVHDQPNLDRVPAELCALIDRCLAKDPGQRPTAAGVLAEAGGTQPLPGWLPDRLTRAFTALPDLPAAVPTPTVVNPELASAFAQTRVGRAQPGSPLTVTAARMQPEWAPVEQPRRDQHDRAGRRVRRGLLRPLAVASIVAGLIGGSAATGFALTGNGNPPVVHTPQMAAAAQTTSPATPAPSATQTSYQPAGPAPSNTPATTTAPPSPSATPTQTMSPAPATSAAPTPAATATQTPTMSPAPATSAAPTPAQTSPAPGTTQSPGPAGY